MNAKPSKDVSAVPSQPPESPWVTYITGKKVSADIFLRGLEKSGSPAIDRAAKKPGTASEEVVVPDSTVRRAFVDALVAKPERIDRLVILLRATSSFSPTIRRTIVELAEASIRHFGIITDSNELQEISYKNAVSTWIRTIRERPLNPANVSMLFLLLLFGIQRKLLDHDTALALAATASRSRSSLISEPHLLDLLLIADPDASTLEFVVAYSNASTTRAKNLTARIQNQVDELGRRADEAKRHTAAIDRLHTENTALQKQKDIAEQRVAELETQIVDIRDGYRHQIYELRERMRGVLDGDLALWLSTALDATHMEPPSIKAIEERLNDALKLVEKESQWLRPSV